MKRTILLCFMLLLSVSAFSQLRLGLRFSPGLSFNRAMEQDPSDTLNVSERGVGLRFFAGPEFNFILGDNYVFTTGIWYATRRAGITITDTEVGDLLKAVYNLQYLQLPVTMKLFTNDIAVDTKLYFQLGGTLDTKLNERRHRVEVSDISIEKFRRFDASILIGTGVQLQMGQNTYLFGGISYTRGLINSVRLDQQAFVKNGEFIDPANLDIRLNNDLLAIDMGLRF